MVIIYTRWIKITLTSQRFRFRENQNRVVNTEEVVCVENVTRSFLLNDTTILSTFQPNLDADQVSISMVEFLEAENRTICVTTPEGMFGGSHGMNAFLMIALALFLLAIISAALCVLLSSLRAGKVKGVGRRPILRNNNYQ